MVTAFNALTEKNSGLRDLITICHCARSQTEYPRFYEERILKFKTSIIPQHVRDIFTDDKECGTILVTGDPADMIFGTYVMSQCVLDHPP